MARDGQGYPRRRRDMMMMMMMMMIYGCTTWTLTKRLEKKLDGNYTRMLRAILNKSWQQHPTRHQLYGHLPPITKTIQVRRTRHAGHCWRSRDELIRDVLLWIPTHGRAKAGRPARTYIQQLCEDTGCCPEDLPRAMNDREEWRERVRDIRATSAIWWWWGWYIYIIKHILFRKIWFYMVVFYMQVSVFSQHIGTNRKWLQVTFKRSKVGSTSNFFFSLNECLITTKVPRVFYSLLITEWRTDGFMPLLHIDLWHTHQLEIS